MTEEENQTMSLVEEAKAIRDEIRQAKEELKAENDRKEKLQAEEILGGKSEMKKPEEPKVETPQEYANKILGGTIEDGTNSTGE